MDADDGVDRLDRLAAHMVSGSASAVGLGDGAVDGVERLEVRLERGREGRIDGRSVKG